MKKNFSFQDDCWISESAETPWTIKHVETVKLLQDIFPYFLFCLCRLQYVLLYLRLLVRLVQANLQQMKRKMWLVTYETNNKEETHPSVLIHWPVMTCLPASPSFYENQTNLFSKHAWQPVLANTQKWAPHKQTNKNPVHSEKDGWQKKMNGKKDKST